MLLLPVTAVQKFIYFTRTKTLELCVRTSLFIIYCQSEHDRPADGLLLPLPRLADDGGRRKLEPGLALVVDGGGGTNLTSGGDRSPPVVALSPRFSASPQREESE